MDSHRDCFLFWSRNAEMVVHAIGLAQASAQLRSMARDVALHANDCPFPQENSGSSPILCHAFSNGGCSGISSLFASVREGKSSSGALSEKAGLYMAAVEAVSAWVFDSCPAFLKTDGSPGRALAVGIPNPVVAWVAEASLNALLGFLVTCCDPTVPQQFWDAFVHAPTQAPQLYIYSDSDDLTDSGYLDALLPQRRAAGVPAHAVKLQESPHVTHLRKAPRAYRTAVAVLLASITEGGIAAKAAAEPFLASGEAQPLRLADDTPAYQSARWVPLPGGDGGVLNVWLPKEAQDVAGQGGGIGVAKL